jgi:RHS repeat-associated protein
VHTEGTGTFVLKSSQVFLYDGWNMIGELQLKESGTGLQPVIQRTYEWGPDVSGSFIGAGGVGGLILIRQPLQPSILRNITSKDEPQTTANNSNPPPTSFAPCYDGNGNVTELCALSTSTVSARYEYSAFGETITVDGSAIADSNPFRFSTKYEDRETGFYYYGYRYYAPETGRWLSRDPIGEKGGVNLYGMVGNDSVNSLDVLGLETGIANYSEIIRLKRNASIIHDASDKGLVSVTGYFDCGNDGFLAGQISLSPELTDDINLDIEGDQTVKVQASEKKETVTYTVKLIAKRSSSFGRDFIEGGLGEAGEHLLGEGLAAGVMAGSKSGKEALLAGGVAFVGAGLWSAGTSDDDSTSYIIDVTYKCAACSAKQRADNGSSWSAEWQDNPVTSGGQKGSQLYWKKD